MPEARPAPQNEIIKLKLPEKARTPPSSDQSTAVNTIKTETKKGSVSELLHRLVSGKFRKSTEPSQHSDGTKTPEGTPPPAGQSEQKSPGRSPEKPLTPQEQQIQQLSAKLDNARDKMIEANRLRLKFKISPELAREREETQKEYDTCVLEYRTAVLKNDESNIDKLQAETGKPAEAILREQLEKFDVEERLKQHDTENRLRIERFNQMGTIGEKYKKAMDWYTRKLEAYNKLNWKTKMVISAGLIGVGVAGTAGWVPVAVPLYMAIASRAILTPASVLAFKGSADIKAAQQHQEEHKQKVTEAMGSIKGENGKLDWSKALDFVKKDSESPGRKFEQSRDKRYNNWVDAVAKTASLAIIFRSAGIEGRELLTTTQTGHEIIETARDLKDTLTTKLGSAENTAAWHHTGRSLKNTLNSVKEGLFGSGSAHADIPGPESQVLPPGQTSAPNRVLAYREEPLQPPEKIPAAKPDNFMEKFNARPHEQQEAIYGRMRNLVGRTLMDQQGVKHIEFRDIKMKDIHELAQTQPDTPKGKFASNIEKFIAEASAKDKLGTAAIPDKEKDNVALYLTRTLASAEDKGIKFSFEQPNAAPDIQTKGGSETPSWDNFFDRLKNNFQHNMLSKKGTWHNFWHDMRSNIRENFMGYGKHPAAVPDTHSDSSPIEPSDNESASPVENTSGNKTAQPPETTLPGKHIDHIVKPGEKLESILLHQFNKQHPGLDISDRDKNTVIRNMIDHRPAGSVPHADPDEIYPGETVHVSDIMGSETHQQEMIKHAVKIHGGAGHHAGHENNRSGVSAPAESTKHRTAHHPSAEQVMTQKYNTPGTPEHTKAFYNHLPQTEKAAIDTQINNYINNQLLQPVYEETHMPSGQQFEFLQREVSGRPAMDIVKQIYEDPDSAEAKFASHLSALKNEKIAELAKFKIDATPLSGETVIQWMRRVAILETYAHQNTPAPDVSAPVAKPPHSEQPSPAAMKPAQPAEQSAPAGHNQPEPIRQPVPETHKTPDTDQIQPEGENSTHVWQNPDESDRKQSSARNTEVAQNDKTHEKSEWLKQKEAEHQERIKRLKTARAYDKYLQDLESKNQLGWTNGRDKFQRGVYKWLHGKTKSDSISYSNPYPLPENPPAPYTPPEQKTAPSLIEKIFGAK